MIKAMVLYGHPTDPDAFEKYYAETHLPIAAKMQGVIKMELTKFVSGPDGAKPAYYRMAEFYFPGLAEIQQTMSSPEGKAATADLSNFASGGVTIIVGIVEN
ncbi:MAG: EthD family reductase [candidate division KSB1 bacterium]